MHKPTTSEPFVGKAALIAKRLAKLADEHGLPNHFMPAEVSANSTTLPAHVVGWIATNQREQLNNELAALGYSMRYTKATKGQAAFFELFAFPTTVKT